MGTWRADGGEKRPPDWLARLPDERSMLLLLGLHLGDDIAVRGAGMELVGPDGRRLSAIPDERLADLEERGFVTIGEAGPAVTPSGRWWCRRWVDWVRGPGTFDGLKRVRWTGDILT